MPTRFERRIKPALDTRDHKTGITIPAYPDMDYLDRLRGTIGVSYQYAFWCDPEVSFTFWVTGSFTIVGLVLPSLLNLLIYGSIIRPTEDKSVHPSKPSATASSQQQDSAMSQTDRDSEVQ